MAESNNQLWATEEWTVELLTELHDWKEFVIFWEWEQKIPIAIWFKNVHMYWDWNRISIKITEVWISLIWINEEYLVIWHWLIDDEFEERIKDIKIIINILETIIRQIWKDTLGYTVVVNTRSRFEWIFWNIDIITRIKQIIENLRNWKKYKESLEFSQEKKDMITRIIEELDKWINYYTELLINYDNISLTEYIEALKQLKYRFTTIETSQENSIKNKKEYYEKVLWIKFN